MNTYRDDLTFSTLVSHHLKRFTQEIADKGLCTLNEQEDAVDETLNEYMQIFTDKLLEISKDYLATVQSLPTVDLSSAFLDSAQFQENTSKLCRYSLALKALEFDLLYHLQSAYHNVDSRKEFLDISSEINELIESKGYERTGFLSMYYAAQRVYSDEKFGIDAHFQQREGDSDVESETGSTSDD